MRGDTKGPQRQPLAPLRSDFAVGFHSEAQIEPLRDATLRLLERTGVRYASPKALAILAKAGARVDEASERVRLPRELVEETLALAPRTFTLGARDPSCELAVGSGYTYGTTDGCGVEVVDWRTGERRKSTKADLEAVTRMQDCLGSISFWWPTVSAGDCGETAQLHEIEAGWNNTSKHLMGMVQGEGLARHAVEMATTVAGGPEGLRRRPVMSNLIGTVSPLVHDKDGIEAGSWLAGVETILQLLQVPLDGCELYTGIGLTNTYNLFIPENLILDDDLYHRARYAFLDIPMDEDALALDVIDAVGPGGHFLAQTHTRLHMRDAVVRAVSQQIAADGQHYRDPLEVARERALDILDNYRPKPLPEAQQAELRRIVDDADREARG